MNKIKCAIIGLGRIGSSLEDDKLREKPASHTGAITSNPDCVLAGGCDIDQTKREIFQKRWNCPLVSENPEELFQKTLPDILHIATPPETHFQIIEKALKFKIPVIICEKPLAENLKTAKKITRLASKFDSIILVNHERRYSLDYIHAKKKIEACDFGILNSIQAKVYMGKNRIPRDVLWDDATHMFDILRFLTGRDFCRIKSFGYPDKKASFISVHALLGEIPLFIEIASNKDYLSFEMELNFSKGLIKIGNGIYEEYKSGKSPYYENFNSLSKTESPVFEKTNYFSGMMKDAVKVFQDKKKKPVSSVYDAFKTIEVMTEILKKNRNF